MPPGSVLKTQKRDLFCVSNFFASGLFRAALLLSERRPDVRFTPKSGHWNSGTKCLLCAKSGHSLPLIRSPGQQWRVGWRYREAEFLSRLEIHHELIVLALNGQARRDWAQRAGTRRMARA
jgi:hypothetical protein